MGPDRVEAGVELVSKHAYSCDGLNLILNQQLFREFGKHLEIAGENPLHFVESVVHPQAVEEQPHATQSEHHADDTISGKIAKDVFLAMLETGKSAADIVESQGLRQVTDTGAIEKSIDDILAAHPDKVSEYQSGKDKLFGFFVGQVMKATGGKANPAMLNDLLRKKLAP